MLPAALLATTTNTAVPRASAFRTGTIRIQLGTDVVNAGGTTTGFTAAGAPLDIQITSADATLDGIAAKVNAAGSDVTATVVNDGTGARLTFKSASGAAKAFTITGTSTGATGTLNLNSLNGGGVTTGSTTTGTRARDARVGRNPRTGETVEVDAKRVPFFKPGKEMRQRLNVA